MNILVLSLLFFVAVFQLIRFFLKFKVPQESIFIMGFLEYVFVIGIFLCSILILKDYIPVLYGRKINSTLLLGFMFTFIAISALCLVDELTIKKIKTLWRLPIIGVLLGYYLDLHYSILVTAVVSLSLLVIFYQNRKRYLYIFRQLFMGILFFSISVLVSLYSDWIYLIFIFVGIGFIYEILNAFMIKFYLLEKGSET